MTIPDFQTLMRPVLAHLAVGDVRQSRQIKEDMAEAYNLTHEERDRLLPSGKQRVMDNRVSWALSYLVQAGLVERPQRGQVRITQLGKEALNANPERIDMKTLEAYPGYRAFKERWRTPSLERPAEVPVADAATPVERIEAAVTQTRTALEAEVLHRALALEPHGLRGPGDGPSREHGVRPPGHDREDQRLGRCGRGRDHQPGSAGPRPDLRAGQEVCGRPVRRPSAHPRVRRGAAR